MSCVSGPKIAGRSMFPTGPPGVSKLVSRSTAEVKCKCRVACINMGTGKVKVKGTGQYKTGCKSTS